MARRATYIQTQIKNSEIHYSIVLDAGNFSSTNPTFNNRGIEKILTGFKRINYDAINLSINDLKLSWSYVKETKNTHNLPFISANIFSKNNLKSLVDPYLFLSKKDSLINIGVFGLTQSNVNIPNDITIMNPYEIASKIVPEMKERCDIVICLADLNMREIEKLLDKCPDIDVVIQSGSKQQIPRPIRIRNTRVVNAGTKGQYVGVLELKLNESKEVVADHGYLKPLDRSVSDVSVITQQNVIDLPKKKREITAKGIPTDYATALFCKTCHLPQYQIWKSSPHAKAFESIEKKQVSQKSECFQCHTTGYLLSGFTRINQTPHLKGVQCEACHGPQKSHIYQVMSLKVKKRNYDIKLKSMITPLPTVDEYSCYKCHTEKTDPTFKYNDKILEIKH